MVVQPQPSSVQQGACQEPLRGSAIPSAVASLTYRAEVSPQTEKCAPVRASRKRMNVQFKHSPVPSHRGCLRYAIPNTDIHYSEKGFNGVQTCNSSMCFVCGAKRQAKNSAILTNIITNTKDSYNYYLVTLTISTLTSVFRQADTLSKAYGKTIKYLRKAVKRCGSTVEISWANDITIDTASSKVHLHRHAIARVPKGHNLEIDGMLFRAWKRAVRAVGGGDVVENAYYFQPLDSTDSGVKYIFKMANEALSSHGKKNSFGSRVGWYGLADAILDATGDVRDRLVEVYRNVVMAMKGKRWFGLSLKMKEDYIEPVEPDCEPVLLETKEERKITIGKVSNHVHRAICDSGYLWILEYVLKTKRDGDIEVETLKEIVREYNAKDDSFWLSEANYWSLVDLVSVWGRDIEVSI